MSWPWDDLGLDGPSSLNEVRRAYAQRLKDVHPEEDPEGFQQLHAAYQKARQLARQAQRGESSAPWNPQPPRPRPAQPDQASAPEEASGPDFTALLEQESTQAPPQPESPESKFDFDDLLNQPQAQEEAPREQQKQQDESWDFQRLLHEEAAQKTGKKHPGGGQKPPKQQAKQPRSRQRRPGLVILAVVLGIFFLLPAAIGLGVYLSGLSDRQSANRISQYIEEDLGYPVELQYADQSQMLFYLPSHHKSFTAWPEGERDLSQGKLGYGTDLGSHLLTYALQTFCDEWGYDYELKLLNEDGDYLSADELPAIYGISTNFMGETEFLTALWEEMDRLSQENWYVLWQPTYQIQMEAWNMPYFTYRSSDGPFPGAEIISHYEEKVPLEVVTYLVEGCDLRELDFGDRAFHLEDLGSVTLHEESYVLMAGVEDATGQTARLYLYNGSYLVSVPPSEFDPDMAHIDYVHLLMGDRIPTPEYDLPWPRIGICRN